jgi:hypothetical protein
MYGEMIGTRRKRNVKGTYKKDYYLVHTNQNIQSGLYIPISSRDAQTRPAMDTKRINFMIYDVIFTTQ